MGAARGPTGAASPPVAGTDEPCEAPLGLDVAVLWSCMSVVLVHFLFLFVLLKGNSSLWSGFPLKWGMDVLATCFGAFSGSDSDDSSYGYEAVFDWSLVARVSAGPRSWDVVRGEPIPVSDEYVTDVPDPESLVVGADLCPGSC